MNLSIKELNELIYSLAVTADKGMMCDKEVNATLLDKVYGELQFKLGWEDEVVENEDTIAERREDAKYEKAFSHFVSNEEADEDYRASLKQDEQRYEDSFVSDSTHSLKSDRFNGVSQAILDMVERQGDATWTEMNEYYRKVTGSNSLSHIIKALMIPYKNRPTRRYLKKVKHGVYAVDYATQYNWVENDVYNYND